MKRILALILALAMVTCVFTGCGKKDEPVKDPTTNVEDVQKPDESTPSDEEVTTPSDEETQPSEDKEPADKQALYEDVFTNGKYTFVSQSFIMDAAGLMKTTCLTDPNNAAYVDVSGTVEGSEVGFALLVKDATTIYFHAYGVEEGETVDQWYKCTGTEAAEEDTTVEEVATTDDFTETMSQINKVEFVETVDGLDKVILYCPVVEEETEYDSELSVDLTVEVEYNGAKGQYRYQEYADGATGYSSTSAIDGFSFGDYEFDAEALTLTKDDEVIKCTLITDHLSEDAETSNEIKIEVLIDADSYAIHNMTMTDETGAVSTVEFVECLDVMEEVELPEEMEEIAYEDAMMQFVFGIFAIALAGAGVAG